MKTIIATVAIVMALGINWAFAQANPNQGTTTSTPSNTEQMQHSQTGNPANPGPRGQ